MRSKTIFALALAALVAVGCSGGGDNNSSAAGTSGNSAGGSKKLQIAVIPKGSTHEYWKSIHEGANKAAAELGVDVTFKGPEKEDDREDQISVVEDFVNKKVDGIVLAPLDDSALVQPVMDAQKANIPVLIIDSGLKGDVTPVSVVSTDNYKGGHIAGEYMAKLLGGKGTVIMLRYAVGSASTMEREQGFLDAIKDAPGIKMIDPHQYAGPTTESAQTNAENMLQPYKKGDGSLSVDGIYTPNESSTFGMLNTLRGLGVAGKVKFVGFDSSAKLLEGLRGGDINGLILQNPRKMGYLGVKMLVDKIRGKTVDAKVDTGATLLTKENVDKPENADLIAPPKV